MIRATAVNVVSMLEQVFYDNGVPELIISDNGQQFVSKKFEELCRSRNITHMRTPFYHPQANPVESSNKNIKIALKTYLKNHPNHKSWANYVDKAVHDLNTSVHNSTNYTPFFLKQGRECVEDANEYTQQDDVEHISKLLNKAYDENINPDEIIENNSDNQLPEASDSNLYANVPCDNGEEETCKEQLIHEQALENNYDSFKENARKHNTRSTIRKFEIGQPVYIDNMHKSDKLLGYAQGLAPKKISGFIHGIVGSNIYAIVDENEQFIGNWHALKISVR